MIQVKPKPKLRGFIRNSAKVIFVAELFAFAGSYFVWYRLNRDQKFRGYMHNNYPAVLEAFYKTGEFLDPEALKRLREIDAAVWAHQTPETK